MDGYVFRDDAQRQQVQHWIETRNIPHLLFSGAPGVGKTTLARILINQLGVDPHDVLEINASRENSVDTIRDKITGFVQTMPFGDYKAVLLDECLDENTLVHVLRDGRPCMVAIKDVHADTDLVKSYDLDRACVEWQPFVKVDQGQQEVYELVFDQGHTVTCTASHKWYVQDQDEIRVVRTDQLGGFMHVLSPDQSNTLQPCVIAFMHESGTAHVYDLSVEKNHNFFITESNMLTHNCDYISPNGQAALRGVMETYANTARFILTCNYPNRVIPALHSRCQGFHIERTDITEFTARVATVLVTENVEFDLDTLDSYVKSTYPDLRKCLNLCQAHSQTGTLLAPHQSDSGQGAEWRLAVVDLFKRGQPRRARELLCESVRPEDMDEVITWAYQHLDLWSTDPEVQDQAILIIRNAAANIPLIADHEINLSAMMVELAQLTRT